MSIETRLVTPDEAEIRLDRWFKRHFPALTHGRLEKLLRTGQVRVDGKRAEAADRLAPGQAVRLPPQVTSPLDEDRPSGALFKRPPPAVSARDTSWLRGLILHQDADVIVLNKPAGLAVQGGTNTSRHLDGMLDALQFDAEERPRLVHRLDRDTSGVLLLARNALSATKLAAAFKTKDIEKLYWAITVGVPSPRAGRIDQPLAKQGAGHEKVRPDSAAGQRAVTHYETLDHANAAAWLALKPETGRTHQLRVHCLTLGCPIMGDGKYAGLGADLPGAELSRDLHLHARKLSLKHPRQGWLEVSAPLPPHMAESFAYLGFSAPKR